MIAIKYWLGNLRNCEVCPADADLLHSMVAEVLGDAGLTPLARCQAVDPRRGTEYEGVSVVDVFIPLAESHCVVHTFPALRWVVVELSTCGGYDEAEAAFSRLLTLFRPRAVRTRQEVFTPGEEASRSG